MYVAVAHHSLTVFSSQTFNGEPLVKLREFQQIVFKEEENMITDE